MAPCPSFLTQTGAFVISFLEIFLAAIVGIVFVIIGLIILGFFVLLALAGVAYMVKTFVEEPWLLAAILFVIGVALIISGMYSDIAVGWRALSIIGGAGSILLAVKAAMRSDRP